MSFGDLNLHPNLLAGIKELGFTRPTPIQADAIPPALAGPRRLACAQTGSGKTAAFLLPILNRLLMAKPRGGPARSCSPRPASSPRRSSSTSGARRPHAAHRRGRVRRRRHGTAGARASAAASTSSSPRRAGCWTISGGRTRSSTALEMLVLDEADRMLDMGFLPDIRTHARARCPPNARRSSSSATMPPPIAQLAREMLRRPRRRSTSSASPRPPSASRRRSIRCRRSSSRRCSSSSSNARRHEADARLHPHQAPREPPAPSTSRARHRRRAHPRQPLAGASAPPRSPASRTAATACWSPPTSPRAASTSRRSATSINFDVPARARATTSTASAAPDAPTLTGDAFTFVAREEEADIDAIEKRLGKRLPRVTVPDFDYNARPEGSSRSRSASGSRRSARRSPRTARARSRSRADAAVAPATAAHAAAAVGEAAAGRGRPVAVAEPGASADPARVAERARHGRCARVRGRPAERAQGWIFPAQPVISIPQPVSRHAEESRSGHGRLPSGSGIDPGRNSGQQVRFRTTQYPVDIVTISGRSPYPATLPSPIQSLGVNRELQLLRRTDPLADFLNGCDRLAREAHGPFGGSAENGAPLVRSRCCRRRFCWLHRVGDCRHHRRTARLAARIRDRNSADARYEPRGGDRNQL